MIVIFHIGTFTSFTQTNILNVSFEAFTTVKIQVEVF
jgi:hypothetical protein